MLLAEDAVVGPRREDALADERLGLAVGRGDDVGGRRLGRGDLDADAAGASRRERELPRLDGDAPREVEQGCRVDGCLVLGHPLTLRPALGTHRPTPANGT